MMCNVSRSCVFFLVLAFSLECIVAAPTESVPERSKRGIDKRNFDKTAKDYIAQISSTIADKDGKPRDLQSAPTSVWCFLDKAVVDDEYRSKPTGEGGRCGAISRFVFNWEAVANKTSVALNKSIIRPYMQIVERHIEPNQIIPVNISVSLRLFHKNLSANTSESSGKFFFIETINVTSNSDGWLELDISPSILSVWNDSSVQLPVLEVTLRMEVDCVNHKKVPFQFVNPAEVELSKPVRRDKFTTLQPLLVIYLEDRVMKEKLYTEKKLADEEKEMGTNGNTIAMNETANARQKRSTPPLCRRENYMVNFTELELGYIIQPLILNIRKCSGDCSYHSIDGDHLIATNHARIKASAKFLNETNGFRSPDSSMYHLPHKNPCCVPVEYEPRYLTLHMWFGIQQSLFTEMAVKRCGCR